MASLASVAVPELSADDFARRCSMRGGNLMWFLGAGASAAAGVPTAADMIWEFKQRLFISQRKVSPKAVADLSALGVRAQLQAHVDSLGGLPAAGAVDEYAALFEVVYPAEADRRTYLDSKLAGARPSYGHVALASMMKANRAKLVWTTNFDSLIADAAVAVYGGTGALTTVTLDAPTVGVQAITEGRWPVEVKLHGDFRSRDLKNTGDELRGQDAQLRSLLVDASRRFGLVVAGYSGRDGSVMDALEEALRGSTPFPAGLFWLQRRGDVALGRVERLIARAVEAGVEAAIVTVENFDEAMRDVTRLLTDIDTSALDSFAQERRNWSAAPRPTGRRGWPVIRLNAVQVVTSPSVCRRVVCGVGGHAEARGAVEQAGVDVLVSRTRAGVLAFGSDSDVKEAFAPFEVTEFDLHPIDLDRLRYESGERSLLRDALTRALARNRGLDATRRRSMDLLAPVDVRAEAWAPLKRLAGSIAGAVKGHADLGWREGIGTRLEWADDRLWMLVEPRVVFDGLTEENKAAAADFARERSIRRYNRVLNDLVAFWTGVLAGGGDEMHALGIGDGVDAAFSLSTQTAFSRRMGA